MTIGIDVPRQAGSTPVVVASGAVTPPSPPSTGDAGPSGTPASRGPAVGESDAELLEHALAASAVKESTTNASRAVDLMGAR